MDNAYVPPYDESKEIEIITDFHNTQIWRVSTTNPNVFLASGNEFDEKLLARLDDKKRCRLIYVVDKIPPLTAILRHLENPFDINWAVMAIIIDQHASLVEKMNPIIRYGLGLAQYKNKFVIGVFAYRHRNNLKEVMDWMDTKMAMVPQDNPVEWFD